MTNDPTKDDEISRLYREAAKAEPPPALDAAIRAAAREALAVRPPATAAPAWRRWRLPVGVFATLVLTVSLTLLVEREQLRDRETKSSAPSAPLARDAALAPAASVATPAPAGPSSTSAPAAAPASPAPQAAPPPAEKPNVRRAEVPQAPAAAARSAEAAPRAEPALAPPVGPVPLEGRADAEMAKPRAAAETGASGRAAASAAQDRAPMPMERAPAAPATLLKQESKAAPQGAAVQRSPELWLEDIRRLRREGRADEARAQLADFVRAYPAYPLPEDLRP
jgi:hypothetical protein